MHRIATSNTATRQPPIEVMAQVPPVRRSVCPILPNPSNAVVELDPVYGGHSDCVTKVCEMGGGLNDCLKPIATRD